MDHIDKFNKKIKNKNDKKILKNVYNIINKTDELKNFMMVKPFLLKLLLEDCKNICGNNKGFFKNSTEDKKLYNEILSVFETPYINIIVMESVKGVYFPVNMKKEYVKQVEKEHSEYIEKLIKNK